MLDPNMLAWRKRALDAEDEVKKPRAAVMWALGDEGSDFGDHIPTDSDGKVAPFWWRTELRKRAFSAGGSR